MNGDGMSSVITLNPDGIDPTNSLEDFIDSGNVVLANAIPTGFRNGIISDLLANGSSTPINIDNILPVDINRSTTTISITTNTSYITSCRPPVRIGFKGCVIRYIPCTPSNQGGFQMTRYVY